MSESHQSGRMAEKAMTESNDCPSLILRAMPRLNLHDQKLDYIFFSFTVRFTL